MRELNQKEGLTIVLVTHDANVGAQCERLISMSDGEITSDDAQVVEVPELVGAALGQHPDSLQFRSNTIGSKRASMNEIFGVPMNSIMVVLLVMLGICLLVVAWVALRRTLLFKMGLRNVPRRPAQTVLVIVGLMLSTLIIAAAFGTGDTIDNSVTSLAYNTLGPIDELVLYSNSEDGEANINGGENQTIPADTRAARRRTVRGYRSDPRDHADALRDRAGLSLRWRRAGKRAGHDRRGAGRPHPAG